MGEFKNFILFRHFVLFLEKRTTNRGYNYNIRLEMERIKVQTLTVIVEKKYKDS